MNEHIQAKNLINVNFAIFEAIRLHLGVCMSKESMMQLEQTKYTYVNCVEKVIESIIIFSLVSNTNLPLSKVDIFYDAGISLFH